MITPRCRRRLVKASFVLAVATSLAFPGSSIGGPAAPVEDHKTSYSIAGLEFSTSQFIEASRFGLKGDGKTDNTQMFRAVLGSGNRTVHISAGIYLTGMIVIPRNTVLLLDPNVIIRDSGRLGPDDRLITIRAGSVYIRGRGAKLISDRHYYHGGEQRHGVFIYGAINVVIDGLQSIGNSGDGFYVGGPPLRPSEKITLENCAASGNSRQGLSITSARQVEVLNCRFDHTRLTFRTSST